MRSLRRAGVNLPDWIRRRDVQLLLGLFIALSLIYNVITPIGESDNEMSHFRYIQYIWMYHRLPPYDYEWPSTPRARCSLPASHASHQFRQPPLYYALNAAIFFWLDLSDDWWPDANPYGYHALNLDGGRNAFLHTPKERFPYRGVVLAVHLIRGFSTLLGVVFLLITYALARLMLGNERQSLLLTAMVVFTPTTVFAASVINNDILVAVLGAGAVYFALRAAFPPAPRMLIPASALFALAWLAKYTAILLVPILFLTFLITLVRTFRTHTYTRRQLIRALPLLLLVALPVAGWFWWNWVHYGHPIPGYAYLTEVIAYHWRKWRVMPWSDVRQHVREAVTFSFISYWGLLGADALTLPPRLLDALSGVWALVLLGGVRAAWRRDFPPRAGELSILSVLGIMLPWLGMFIAIVYAPRGRYILALYPFIAYLLLLGARGWGTRNSPNLGLWVYAGLVLAVSAYAPFGVIRPAFTPPNTHESTRLVPGEWPIHATFGDLAELVGVQVTPKNAAPGDEITVTLRWRVLRQTDNNYVVGVHLQGLDNSYMGGTAHWPVNGRYATSLWKPGDVFLDSYHFRLSPKSDTPLPQGAQVLISMYCQSEKGDKGLPVRDGQGTLVGDFLLTPPIRVGPPTKETTTVEGAPIARFGEEIGLLDVKGVPSNPFTAPGMTNIYVRLKTLTKPRKDYTMYIQLLDERQKLWVTADYPLGKGIYPSHLWLPGEQVVHEHPVPLGRMRQLPVGTYYLVMGIYDSATGQRLPPRGDGVQTYANSYLLTSWHISRILHVYVPYISITTEDTHP